MPAPTGNQYARGNKGGRGGPSKFEPEYIEIASRLCERGLTDAEIAEVLGVSERFRLETEARRVRFSPDAQ